LPEVTEPPSRDSHKIVDRAIKHDNMNQEVKPFWGTGWTVAVLRTPKGAFIRELYDCAINNFREAEAAVAGICGSHDLLMITALEPLASLSIRTLGLQPGEVRKRESGKTGASPKANLFFK
jgi:hypothetical protein